MADLITRNPRTRKKDPIEQFGFKKTEDGIYTMKLKGVFEEHPNDYLDITLNLNRERITIWGMPGRHRLTCNSTLDKEGMLEKSPEWLSNFFNHRVQMAVDTMHIYVYKDMPEPDYGW